MARWRNGWQLLQLLWCFPPRLRPKLLFTSADACGLHRKPMYIWLIAAIITNAHLLRRFPFPMPSYKSPRAKPAALLPQRKPCAPCAWEVHGFCACGQWVVSTDWNESILLAVCRVVLASSEEAFRHLLGGLIKSPFRYTIARDELCGRFFSGGIFFLFANGRYVAAKVYNRFTMVKIKDLLVVVSSRWTTTLMFACLGYYSLFGSRHCTEVRYRRKRW